MNEHERAAQMIKDYKESGWLFTVLAFLGAFAKMVFTGKDAKIFVWGKICFAGAAMGTIMYFVLYGVEISPLYKTAICSAAGPLGPEIWKTLVEKLKDKIK